MNRIYILVTAIILLGLTALSAQINMSIKDAREADPDGILINEGLEVTLDGKAIGPNFRAGGQNFILVDIGDAIGITVFVLEGDLGYEVQDYQNIRVTGFLKTFNGLAEIEATSIDILNPGGFNPSIPITTVLDESTESYLVSIKNVSLLDPSQWQPSGSFNVDITNGSEIMQMRIDSDTDISGMLAPTGTFSVTGIGGQFDNVVPYDEGYQLFPRSVADIDPYNTTVVSSPYRVVGMGDIRENDADGVPLLDGELVEVAGIVHGTNFRPSGLQFYILNEFNQGVSVFETENPFGYEVTPGDLLGVQGTIGHFNGLTQLAPDSIWIISSSNQLLAPREITTLDESTEASYVTFSSFGTVDPAEWLGDGSSFNIDFLDVTGNVITVRIDSDTYYSDQAYVGFGNVIQGIGGQFDNSAPHDEGYQLLPSFNEDIYPFLSTYDLSTEEIEVYPNPTSEILTVSSESIINGLSVYDLSGRLLLQSGDNSIDLTNIIAGPYLLDIETAKGHLFKRIIKQ